MAWPFSHHIRQALQRLTLGLCAAALMGQAMAAGASGQEHAVTKLMQRVATSLEAVDDREAMATMLKAWRQDPRIAPSSSSDAQGSWVALVCDGSGALRGVTIDARRLLAAPRLVQEAVLLHELEHLKHAAAARRHLKVLLAHDARLQAQGDGVAARMPVLRAIIRTLVEDEARAYRRDVRTVQAAVQAQGGFARYLATLPPRDRQAMTVFYAGHVAPLLTPAGTVDEAALHRHILLGPIARRYPSYVEAALLACRLPAKPPRLLAARLRKNSHAP